MCKYALCKCVYDIISEYNNACHTTIKMKPVDVKSSTYIDSSDKDPKFKIGDIVRISKYKNIFAKGYVPNWSEEVFIITKIKNLSRGLTLLVILKGKKLLECFVKKNCKNNSKRV